MPEDPQAAMPAPSPEAFMQMLGGFQMTALMKAALELDLFTQIGKGAQTPAELASACACAERGARIIADSLATVGLLFKHNGRYRLTPDGDMFLRRDSPGYVGSVADFLASPQQMEGFRLLAEAARRGGSALGPDPAHAPDSPLWVNFARNMGPLQRFVAQAQAELLVPRAVSPCKVLDIAAGHGMFGIAMAQRNPHAQVYALDWPSVLEVAAENAALAGVADRWHKIPGSAFDADLGREYDWILLPNFLHHFDIPTCEGLLRRVRAAVRDDGQNQGELAILDFIPDEDRLGPPRAALFAMIMLASTPAGDTYTYTQLEQMLRHAGFGDSELHTLGAGAQRVVIAGIE
jgi:hypothetical protein